MERFLLTIQRQKFNPMGEDKLLLKGVADGGFFVKRMYKVLDLSPNIVFPSRSIWNSDVPPPKRLAFSLGKLPGVKCSYWTSLNGEVEPLLTDVFVVKRTRRL